MLNIFRNLGKHWVACLAVVALLIVQASCDLALPGYTSDIVDVGIQQGGVDSALPDTVRDTTLQALKILMPDEEAAALEAAYAPADENGVRALLDTADADTLASDLTMPDVALYMAAASQSAKRQGVAVSLIADYPSKMRMDDIAKNTRNEIVPVKFDENGHLAPA